MCAGKGSGWIENSTCNADVTLLKLADLSNKHLCSAGMQDRATKRIKSYHSREEA
jgi:hypothetical protein